MAKQIKPREFIREYSYELNFYDMETHEIRYGFPMTNEKVIPLRNEYRGSGEQCKPEECIWWQNYLDCKADDSLSPSVEKVDWSYTEPAHYECECGKEITINYDAEECEYCGKMHNLFGQELLPREQWGWCGDNEDY